MVRMLALIINAKVKLTFFNFRVNAAKFNAGHNLINCWG